MFWTNSKDWKKIAEDIRDERYLGRNTRERNPLKSDMELMFANIQGRFIDKSEISFEERKDICELLFEIYQELNTLKPIGKDYKECFDARLIDTFIKTLKMANDYNGQSFVSYGPAVISWLEDYKKTYLNEKNNIKQPDYTR